MIYFVLRRGQGDRNISLDGGRVLLLRGILHIFVFVSLVYILTMLSLGSTFPNFTGILNVLNRVGFHLCIFNVNDFKNICGENVFFIIVFF